MNKTKIIKRILIVISIAIIGIFAKNSSVWSATTIKMTDLYNSTKYYCMELYDKTPSGEFSLVNSRTYTSNNATQKYRALAYILYQAWYNNKEGYNGKSVYQIAVWEYYYHQYNVGDYDPCWDELDTSVYDKAMTVSQIPYSNEAGISASDLTMTGETGSFTVNSLTGTVTKMTVTFTSNVDSSEHTEWFTASGQTGWIRLYSDSNCTNVLRLSEISDGTTVYVKNLNLDYRITDVTFTVYCAASGYEVTRYRWTLTTSSTDYYQDLLSAEITVGKDTTVTKSIDVKYAYGSLKIKKNGVYYQNGNKVTEENLTVSFKIYCTTLSKWVKRGDDGYKYYVDGIENATTYTYSLAEDGSEGKTITKLFTNYNYRIYEVDVENDYYKDIYMVGVTVDGVSQTSEEFGKSSNHPYYMTGKIKIGKGTTQQVIITDCRTYGDITICKVDKMNNTTYIPGVKVKIYCMASEDDGKTEGWVIQNSDGTYSYDGTVDTATEFETDSNGKIELKCIRRGWYYVYETGTPDGIAIEDQPRISKCKWR